MGLFCEVFVRGSGGAGWRQPIGAASPARYPAPGTTIAEPSERGSLAAV